MRSIRVRVNKQGEAASPSISQNGNYLFTLFEQKLHILCTGHSSCNYSDLRNRRNQSPAGIR